MTTRQTILIADDDTGICRLLEILLTSVGYAVQIVQNGQELVDRAYEVVPDLMLVDVMMPQLDGYEALRLLRNDTRTAHIPVIVLTARTASGDLVTGFESGADDYVTKPFDGVELLARIKSLLRRVARRPVRSPLTGLPGNVLIVEEIRFRLRQPEPFALLYIDLNNFKAFNDIYGFARGDQVIRLVAEILTDTVGGHAGDPESTTRRDFIGHIGGDDFALLTIPQRISQICAYAIEQFASRVRSLYSQDDLDRGYLEALDRHGILRRFPITGLAVGGITSHNSTFDDPDEVGRRAAEMKHAAKLLKEGGYIIDGETFWVGLSDQ